MISKDFLTGGHAIFTATNPKGEHYTYKVTAPRDLDATKPVYFVSCLTGPNNLTDYTYLGLLLGDGTVRHTAKSGFKPDSVAFKVAAWVIGKVWAGEKLPEGYDAKHIGRCGVCGRPLTDPISIDTGIGPICAGR